MQSRCLQSHERTVLTSGHVLRDGFSRWCFLSRAPPRNLARSIRRKHLCWQSINHSSFGEEAARDVGGFQEQDAIDLASTSSSSLFATTVSVIPHLSGQRTRNAGGLKSAFTVHVSAPCMLHSRFLGCLAAATVAFSSVPVAEAYNVRVEDVENPAMQAGLVAANEERWAEAERFFAIVIQQEGGASAWSNLGNVHLSQGRPEVALDDFTHAISLAPQAAVPYLNRALAQEEMGVRLLKGGRDAEARSHFLEALQDCNSSISRDPKEFAAYFNRGNVQMWLAQYADALESFREAADLAPGIAGYRLREAQLLFQNAKSDEAVRMTKGVVRRNPNYAEAHVTLAAISWAGGQGARAEAEFDAALEVDTRWGNLSFVRNNTRWPPALYTAMEDFLSLSHRV